MTDVPITREERGALKLLGTSWDRANAIAVVRKYESALTALEKERDELKKERRGMSADPNVEAVRTKLLARAERGLAKYGVNTAREDVDLCGWLNHLQQELMDASVYIERTLSEVAALSVLMKEKTDA